MVAVIQGRVWKFGEDINTDLMAPAVAMNLPFAEAIKYCFSANRPGWAEQVKPGDIIVGGRNFGTGSSRPAAQVLKGLGITGLVAETINGLFLRNCVNFGLPALACAGVAGTFEEGDIAEVDFKAGRIINRTRDVTLTAPPLPDLLLRIIDAGGVIPMLDAAGCLEPLPPK
ncbi:MAG: 3-isopropylmalate dehydratase [Chloroflexota bacterium]